MKDEINKRIYLDLFASWPVIGPVVVGLTGLIGSWFTLSGTLAVASFAVVLVGLGVFTTKWIWGLDDIVKKAQEAELTKRETNYNSFLDELDQGLTKDKDARPETCLRELRRLRASLKANQSSVMTSQVTETFDKLFDETVKKIAQTYVLWSDSLKLSGAARTRLREDREKLVIEIEETTKYILTTIEPFQKKKETAKTDATVDLRQELAKTIEIAKRVDQRMSELNGPNYDPKQFE